MKPLDLCPVSSLFRLGALLLVFLLLGGCADEKAEQGAESGAVPVRTAIVEAADFNETADGVGSLESPEEVRIKPEISAILEAVHFEEGEEVEKGDLLFSLDSDKIKSELAADLAALESAKASLEDARANYLRFKALYETQTVSEQEFDTRRTAFRTARAEVERLQAQVELTRERIGDTEIRSPISGVLSERLVDPGDYVEDGDLLVTIYVLDPLEISFRVAESYMGRVKKGQRVEVRLAAVDMEPCIGEVVFVGPNIAPDTRKFLVKASVCNPEGRLKPGAFARAEIVLDSRQGRPAVPETALVSERGGYSVYVVESGKALRRQVKIGLRRPGLVEIAEGASVGEEIVVEGQMRLTHGVEVSRINEQGEGAGRNGS